jgi:hypothetical protein
MLFGVGTAESVMVVMNRGAPRSPPANGDVASQRYPALCHMDHGRKRMVDTW